MKEKSKTKIPEYECREVCFRGKNLEAREEWYKTPKEIIYWMGVSWTECCCIIVFMVNLVESVDRFPM